MMLTTKSISPYCIPGLISKKKFDQFKRRYSIEEVAEIVCKNFDLSLTELKKQRRFRTIVEPRQLIGYICTKLLHFKYKTEEVGRFWGQNHATIINGNKTISNLMKSNAEFQYKAMVIFKILDI